MADDIRLTDQVFWDSIWGSAARLRPVEPSRPGPGNYAHRKLHEFYTAAIAGTGPRGKRLIELGCGGSSWLPYYRATFGCEITGLDYSPVGCKAAQALLDDLNMDGQIILGDLFKPPAELLGCFDYAVSNGLVEHFLDTAAAIAACAAFLKPGGMLITSVPNFTGPQGWLLRRFDRPLYDKHVPLGRADLVSAHARAGLEIVSCEYVILADMGVGPLRRLVGHRLAQAIKLAVFAPVWMLGPMLGLKPNRFTSPYLYCLARKPH